MPTQVETLPDGRVKVGGATVSRGGGGYLHCSQCSSSSDKTGICEHIRTVLTEGLDWRLMGAPDAEWSGIKLPIPLVPKHHQWAEIEFGEPLAEVLAYPIKLIVNQGSRKVEEPLGFIHQGEGRLVIRSMIWDWFRGNVETWKLRCKATKHGFKEEQAWLNHQQDAELAFADQWAVYTEQHCLSCLGILQAAFDGLIPDDAKAPSPWS